MAPYRKTQKPLDFPQVPWHQVVMQCLRLCRICPHPIPIHYMTEEFKLWATEVAFLKLDGKASLLETIKHTLDVTKVFLSVFRKDDNIIQVHHAAVSKAASQHLTHQPLEGGWSALQTKRHDSKMEQPKRCDMPLAFRVHF